MGLGLYDEKDVTLKGIEAIKNADVVYGEFYTSRLTGTHPEKLAQILDREITILPREEVEDGRKILADAEKRNVVLLVGGDPMVATTHVSLAIEARKRGIDVKIIHGQSIMSAVCGLTGLHSYKFGRSATIPFPYGDSVSLTPYEVIKMNKKVNAHTMLYLDIKEEPMRISAAVRILEKMEEKVEEGLLDDMVGVGIARAGSMNPSVKCDYVRNLKDYDFGPPMHVMVVLADKLHFMEAEALRILAEAPKEIEQMVE